MRSLVIIVVIITLSPVQGLMAQSDVQTSPLREIDVRSDAAQQILDVRFSSENEIASLLVIVSDKRGETLFLDNQYRFKGEYKRVIDLKEYGKGEFFLKVVRDEDIFDKKITIQ
jgi:hypothetical protein